MEYFVDSKNLVGNAVMFWGLSCTVALNGQNKRRISGSLVEILRLQFKPGFEPLEGRACDDGGT
jgi:hypothetical protein